MTTHSVANAPPTHSSTRKATASTALLLAPLAPPEEHAPNVYKATSGSTIKTMLFPTTGKARELAPLAQELVSIPVTRMEKHRRLV